jgi:hypothetical protein
LPSRKATEAVVTKELFAELNKIEDADKLASVIRSVDARDLKEKGQLGDLVPLLRKMLNETEYENLWWLYTYYALVPELHESFIQKTGVNSNQKQRLIFAKVTQDAETIVNILNQMEPDEKKESAIYQYGRSTGSLQVIIDFFEEGLQIPTEKKRWYDLKPEMIISHAYQDPELAYQFIKRHEAETRWAAIFDKFQQRCVYIKEKDASEYFLQKAWQHIRQSENPEDFIAGLLSEDPQKYSRQDWKELSDKWVIPAVVKREKSFRHFSHLIKIDLDLMLEMTQKACQGSGKSFNEELPDVVALAYGYQSQTILDWLREMKLSCRDKCIESLVKRGYPTYFSTHNFGYSFRQLGF